MSTAKTLRSLVAGVLCSAAVAIALGLWTSPAAGASSVRSGWWTSAPLLVAPDVSAGQLLVQGGASIQAPVAYAGITFVLVPGERPQTLTVAVAAGSASTPGTTLTLCPLLAAATPAQGAPASSGPAFDCATSVDAPASSDGTTYEFDVSAVLDPGSLGVAVVASGPSHRVVLEKPNTSALQSAAPAAAPGPGPTVPPTTTAPAVPTRPSSGAASAPSSPGGRATAPTASATPPPTAAPRAGAPPTGVTTTTPPVAAAADGPTGVPARSASASSGDRSFAPFAFVGMAMGAAALWSVSGQRPPSASDHPGDAE